MNRQNFISLLIPGAQKTHEIYNVFSSVIMAQAILETGWGKYILGNNLFGIKAQRGYTGAKAVSTTSEYIKGKRIEIKVEFRAYTSFEESMLDHGKLLGELKRYKNVKTAKNYDMACRALQASGYATDPLYAEKLVSITENNRLYQYDKIEKSLNQDTKKLQENLNLLFKFNLNVDGIVGEKTRAAIEESKRILETQDLYNTLECILKKSMQSKYISTVIPTRYIQYKLKIDIDGIFGSKTMIAVMDFQRQNKLVVDGIVGTHTWETLIK